MAQINAYEGPIEKLGKAEQYYREIGQVPRLLQRLQTFHFKLVGRAKRSPLPRIFAECSDLCLRLVPSEFRPVPS